MIRKSIHLLLGLITLLLLVVLIPAGVSQSMRPEEDQVRAFLNEHPLITGSNTVVLDVSIQGEGLVIDARGKMVARSTFG